MEEPRTERLRRLIGKGYESNPTGCGRSFGEMLCWEIHENGMTFNWLAEKWGVSLPRDGRSASEHADQSGSCAGTRKDVRL